MGKKADKTFKKILIVGHANIGDTCYDLVFINPLRRAFPQAEIVFLTSSRAKDIAQDYAGVDRVVTFDKHTTDRGLLGRLRIIFRLRREGFDLVIVLKNSQMYKFLDIPHAWRVEISKYIHRLPPQINRHVVDVYLDSLQKWGVPVQQAAFDFASRNSSCEDFLRQAGIKPGEPIVGILPFGGWHLKDWPLYKWNKLAEMLKRQYNITVVAFGKTAGDSVKQEESRRISPHVICAIDKISLKQGLRIIKKCKLFIGGDSSLTHLASCMGIETISLYGATPKDSIYPYFHYDNIITSKQALNCMPCYPALSFCPCRDKKALISPCMEGISVESVLSMVRQKLNL